MPTTQEISSYVTGLASATLAGTEEVYLATDEKTTTQAIADLNGNLITTIVNIGDWNMDADTSATIAHGIADYTKIRAINVMIRNDATTSVSCLIGVYGTIGTVDSTNIEIIRVTAGAFDSVNYDSTSYNRGYITIQHIP